MKRIIVLLVTVLLVFSSNSIILHTDYQARGVTLIP